MTHQKDIDSIAPSKFHIKPKKWMNKSNHFAILGFQNHKKYTRSQLAMCRRDAPSGPHSMVIESQQNEASLFWWWNAYSRGFLVKTCQVTYQTYQPWLGEASSYTSYDATGIAGVRAGVRHPGETRSETEMLSGPQLPGCVTLEAWSASVEGSNRETSCGVYDSQKQVLRNNPKIHQAVNQSHETQQIALIWTWKDQFRTPTVQHCRKRPLTLAPVSTTPSQPIRVPKR